MTDALSAVQNEQRRLSEEVGVIRGMSVDLIKSISELVSKLSILEVQYKESASRQGEIRATIREHSDKIEAIRISQASNEYVLSLVKAANRNIFLAAVSAMSCAGVAVFTTFKG